MFFESRLRAPEVSEPYRECARLFEAGRCRDARREAQAQRRQGGPRVAEDALLCSDVSRAGGFHRESFATVKLAAQRFPDSWHVQFEWTRVLSVRGRLLEAMRRAEALADGAPAAERQLVQGLRASVAAQIGFADTARGFADTACGEGETGDPRVWYELAYAALCLHEWDTAIERGQRVVRLAPRWPRGALFLAQALLARGQVEESQRLIRACLDSGVEDAGVELIAGYQAFDQGEHEQALSLLLSYEYSWLRPRTQVSLAPSLALLPWALRDHEAALQRVREVAPALEEDLGKAFRRDGRRLIGLPTMCQERVLCVPTSVALVSEAQGVHLDPKELFTAMEGREGTAMWRMCAEMRRRGFAVHFIAARAEAVRGMLDQGQPLIGQLEGVFNNHVEVICGYDPEGSTYFCRDPESWALGVLEEQELEQRYALSGGGLAALIAPARLSEVRVDPEWLAPEAEALVRFEEAVACGELETAEQAHALIADGSPAVLRRDVTGRGVTLTPMQFARSMEAIARDEKCSPLARLRAILALDSPDLLDEVLESLDRPAATFGPQVMRLIGLGRLRFAGDWQGLADETADLLESFASLEMLWIGRAEALAELGRLDEARLAAANALQLVPDSPGTRNRVRTLFPDRRPFDEELAELESLYRRYPDNHLLLLQLAELLAGGGDGLKYEEAAARCCRMLPRLPECHARLADWYLQQGRADLAVECLKRGRQLIGVDELPLWDFEREQTQEQPEVSEPGSGEVPVRHDSAAAVADKAALLIAARREFFAAVNSKEPENATTEILEKLRDMARGGELQWFEAAELVGLEIDWALLRTDTRSDPEPAVAAVLPERLKGPVTSALAMVLERCTMTAFPRRVAATVLRWAEGLCEAVAIPHYLAFNLSFLREASGDLSSAEASYRHIADEHPGFAPALYRLGEICAQQGALAESIVWHRRALDSSPGLGGSLRALLALYGHLGKTAEAIQVQRAICRLQPRSEFELEELTMLLLEVEGIDAAQRAVEDRKKLHRPLSVQLIHARLLARAGEYRMAERALARCKRADGDQRQHLLITRIMCALGEERWHDAERLARRALKAAPEDAWLLGLRGYLLGRQSAEAAEGYHRKLLLRGQLNLHFATAWLSCFEAGQADHAIKLLNEAEARLQADLGRLCSSALLEMGLIQEQMRLLRWCSTHLEQVADLDEQLARRLVLAGRPGEAQEVAAKMYAADPESPHALELLAFCLQGSNPVKALGYLEQAHARTGSASSLAEIGVTQLALDEAEQARDTFFQVLERDPVNELALTNLVLMGEPPGSFFDQFCTALERGYGVHTRSFHVLAVRAALDAGRKLPPAWMYTARDRLRVVLEEGNSSDELVRLVLALSYWLEQWREFEEARLVRNLASAWKRFWVGLRWPGKGWVGERVD